MKNKNLCMLAAALVIGSCSQLPIAYAVDPTPVPTLPSGDFKSQFTVSLDGTKVNYQGQTYVLRGSVHVDVSGQQKNVGTTLRLHYNAQNASVVAPDGTVYRLAGASNTQVQVDSDGATFKSGANFGLIGKGKAPNYHLHVNLVGTVSNDGRVTLSRTVFELR